MAEGVEAGLVRLPSAVSRRVPLKPRALKPGDAVSLIAPSSPFDLERFDRGCRELDRLGHPARFPDQMFQRDSCFAGSAASRREILLAALDDAETCAVIAARGGYGATEILDGLDASTLPARPKIVLGYSDITAVQVFLWQAAGWVTFYGPMVAAGFDTGAGAPGGYDEKSILRALTEVNGPWDLNLSAEVIVGGQTEGRLLGGCLTMLQTTIGTPWQLDPRGSILLLEDRGMKPYQVDRALVHLRQAGLFDGVRGFILGDFPECEPVGQAPALTKEGFAPVPATEKEAVSVPWLVCDVVRRVLAPLGVPIVYGAPVGHTPRPMLTVPLGIRARLDAQGAGKLTLVEGAVEG